MRIFIFKKHRPLNILFDIKLFHILLELEMIQTHMAQKPTLWVEVRSRCVARESKRKRG